MHLSAVPFLYIVYTYLASQDTIQRNISCFIWRLSRPTCVQKWIFSFGHIYLEKIVNFSAHPSFRQYHHGFSILRHSLLMINLMYEDKCGFFYPSSSRGINVAYLHSFPYGLLHVVFWGIHVYASSTPVIHVE